MNQLPRTSVTHGLVLINVVVWLIGLLTGAEQAMQIEGGFWAARVYDSLHGSGSQLPSDYGWAVPLWLTPVTSAFLHAGFFHLLMNMLVLLVIGRMVELGFGPGRLMILYGAGMVAAAAMHYWVDPLSVIPVVGASGAISALLAFYFLMFARRKPQAIGPVPGMVVHMAWLLAAWVGLNLLSELAFSTSTFGIAIWAHIGGFLAGLALTAPLAWLDSPRTPRHDLP
ncbi:rhomboid family intramembrane serine protease [Blastomonas sp.]|uniref:rhomboid family intramembrane serine protease n=1 Tax=Blastomonas sp. TaxID=1909299 RepID=UPI0035931D47